MRILFIHEVNYLTKPIYEMHEFPEYLAEKGHEIAFLHFPEGFTKERIKSLGWKTTVTGRVLANTSITLFTPQLQSGSFANRLLYALRAKSSVKRAVLDFKPQVIVSFSVPTSGWQALQVAKSARIPFVFRALDVSHKIRSSVFSPLIKLAEKYIYSNADLVSTNNPAMALYCRSLGSKESRTVVNLPPLNLEHFFGAKKGSSILRDELRIPKYATVILYMGSFFYFSGLPEFIRQFSLTAGDMDYLVLVGGGEQDAELRALVSELKITKKVIFTGFVSFEDLPKYLGIADVAVNPMIPSLVSNAAFPNKVVQYMATGLPVVSTELEGLRLTFEDPKGLIFEGTPQRVADKALEISKNKQLLQKMGEGNSQIVSNVFSRSGAVSAFEEAIEELRIDK